MAALEDIATHLVNSGVGTAIGTDVFLDFSPDSPDSVIVLYSYGGDMAPEEVMGRNLPIATTTGIQVQVRGDVYTTTRTKATSAWNALWLTETVIGTTTYHKVTPIQKPFVLEKDNLGRWVFGFNVSVLEREP